ncbi:hypothetical protein ACIPQ1_12115 [Pseudomonas sp. LARHCG127]|uniref:hypothetical protein n=1 Tax=unclassified Pseudomonas TaxID=196821 RepID=UPI0020348B4E|nr:hypothetical protein [Pseudomonas sp. CG7]MCM2462675.1 hypothetical protein [Pseudomonas sp. CG7]
MSYTTSDYRGYEIRAYSADDPEYPNQFQVFSKNGNKITLPQRTLEDAQRHLDASMNPDDHARY